MEKKFTKKHLNSDFVSQNRLAPPLSNGLTGMIE